VNPYQSPKADVTAKPARKPGAPLMAIFCILFGGMILLSSVSSLLGITSSHAHPQSQGEALGNKIGSLLIAGMSGYLVLYGLKKLKKPSAES